MKYQAVLVVDIESTLDVEKLNDQMIIALWDSEKDITTKDGDSPKLVVLDYRFTEVKETI